MRVPYVLERVPIIGAILINPGLLSGLKKSMKVRETCKFYKKWLITHLQSTMTGCTLIQLEEGGWSILLSSTGLIQVWLLFEGGAHLIFVT